MSSKTVTPAVLAKPSRLAAHVCTGVIVLSAALASCGCEKTGTATSKTKPDAGAESSAAAPVDNHCRDLMQSIVGTFELSQLGVSSDLNQAVSLMNQWARSCRAADAQAFMLTPASAGALAPYLSIQEFKAVEHGNYTMRDGQHLRNCRLFRTLQERNMGKTSSELGRIANLFKHVVRNLDLVEQHRDGIPLSIFETYLIGHGTAEDRAWLFGSMLRQMKIDCVVLFPEGTKADAGPAPFLIGVLLEGQVYLFDPRAGLPIPAPATADGAEAVATLTQVRAEPALLKALDIDAEHPYPITAENLGKPSVGVIGDTSTWSPRMEQIQPEFTGARAMIVFDSLIDSEGRRGLLSRVANYEAGAWEPKSVGVWKYPEGQLAGFESLSGQHSQTLARLTLAWNAPIEIDMNTGALKPGKKLFTGRIAQVEARYDDAATRYTAVQIGRKNTADELERRGVPRAAFENPQNRLMMDPADEDAVFFTGVCKLEQGTPGDLRVAADKFRHYLKHYENGVWTSASRYLLALTLADQGKPAEAVELLKAIPADHPQKVGIHYLIRKWDNAAAKSAPAAEPAAPAKEESAAPNK